MIDARARRLARGWPFLVLAVLAVVFVLMLVFSRKAPVIGSMDPAMAAPGEQVVISGDYFGRTEREGTLSIAGEIPPPSLIHTWSDQKIVFTVPEDAASGLVTVSNSQGTSTGVLFTNTQTIPTVLQLAGDPSKPLLWSAVPVQPLAGQAVTVSGRGFGQGDEAVFVKVAAGANGPVFEVGPAESLVWTNTMVTFRWPSGADTGSSVSVSTPRGESAPFVLGGPSPVVLESPRTVTVEFRAKVAQPSATAVNLWGPVPQRSAGTPWMLSAANPPPAGTGLPVFAWSAGSASDREASYRLTLTAWTKRWTGLPPGPVPATMDVPTGDNGPQALWKPAAATLKAMSAKWGLDAPDPWLRLQRLQTGLAAAVQAVPGPREQPILTRPPSDLLASGKLDSYEVSSLAAALALQAGLAPRLVGGLWLNGEAPQARTWVEVWIPGGGWVSWDVIDGSPGSLDNRHFAFDTGGAPVQRRLPRSTTFGPGAPGTLASVSGEAAGPGPEPVVQWEIIRAEK